MGATVHRVLMTLALCCLINHTRGVAVCIAAERDALVAFNTSINDPHGK
uniref:Uncharacterized protein n=1 Tax=Arundo donax TaxID=35708 RepID=A0A0A9AV89_ARUDO